MAVKKTVDGLLKHCKSASEWKYVYGAKGTVLTKSQIQSLINQYPTCSFASDVNKAGYVCCDCSGFISSYTGILRGSSDYYDTAISRATIAQYKANPSKYKGWAVWMRGHIGVADGEGGYYAMDGSQRNWVHYDISKNKFTHVIKLKDIDYTSVTTSATSTTKTEDTHDASINNGYPHYRGHIQGIGWDKVCGEGGTCGTVGKSKRLEAIKIDYPNQKIHAAAHIQGKGDVDFGWITKDTIIGTVGQSKRIESLYLEGNIQFRVHIQSQGWTNWTACTKGAWLGTKGKSLRLEAIEIKRL